MRKPNKKGELKMERKYLTKENITKEDIKTLSERKGMTMGELIEEMMEVYQKHQ